MIDMRTAYLEADKFLKDMVESNKKLYGVNLNDYFVSVSDTTSIESITKRLFLSLRNRNLMRTVVKYDDKKDIIDPILFYFDPKKILENWNSATLYKEFQKKFSYK